jgi:tetratricopeptide (TPR) repeat protein
VELASAAGPAALEVGAWASYFGRSFAHAAQFAADGAVAAEDGATRARCLAAGGRTSHAAGDLTRAEMLLGEAFSLAEGADRVTAAAWLGVLRSHQSRTAEALSLLRPAARGQVGVEHTAATLHSLLFTGHSRALAGQPALALEAFARYDAELERRQVPRFAGRAVNFSGWVLRNLGASAQALDHHRQALDVARHHGTAEVAIAALEDLAEQCLDAGDLDGARSRLDEAAQLLQGDLVFGWRLELKLRLVSGRVALQAGQAEEALAQASWIEERAVPLAVPRYASVAGLLRHRAMRALGQPPDLDAISGLLDVLDDSVAIEAWWWTGDMAAAVGCESWIDRAADRAERLARQAGPHAATLRDAAERRMAGWRLAARQGQVS